MLMYCPGLFHSKQQRNKYDHSLRVMDIYILIIGVESEEGEGEDEYRT